VGALEWASARELGLVHFDRRDVEMYDSPVVLRDAANALGIKLGALAMYELERLGIEDVTRAHRIIDEDIDLAVALGVTYIYLPSFNAAEIRDRNGLIRTAELLSYALDSTDALTVASENSLSGSQNIELFRLVNNRRLRLLYDTQNPILFGLHPGVLASQTAHLIGRYVHVKDGIAGEGDAVVGCGMADVRATLAILCRAGFTGEFVFEGAYRTYGSSRLIADVNGLDLALSACRQ
jgi:sugar phosphate isomerase/epimerase